MLDGIANTVGNEACHVLDLVSHALAGNLCTIRYDYGPIDNTGVGWIVILMIFCFGANCAIVRSSQKGRK
jgi:hypothetical protein